MEFNPNLARLVRERTSAHPDRRALVQYRGGRPEAVTYAGLAERVEDAVARLRARGIGPGDRVLVFVPMSIDLYATLLACFHVGAPAVFVDAWADRQRLSRAVEAAAPKAFIGTPKAHLLRLACGTVRRIPLHLAPNARVARKRTPVPEPEWLAPDHPALITLTTGSTGRPRAAARSHAFLWAQHESLARVMQPGPDDVDMTTLPIVVLNNLALGLTSVLPECDPRRPAKIRPDAIFRQIAAEGVRTSSGSPAFYERLAGWCREQGHVLPLRSVFTGGAPIFPALARVLQEVVVGRSCAVYGSTEAEPIAALEVGEMLRRLAEDGLNGLPAGRPVPEIECRIARPNSGSIELDGDGWRAWDVPAGETGELVVTGPHVLGAYLNDPEAERRAKVRDGARTWHRTGDAARLDGSGILWLMGRVEQRVRHASGTFWPLPAELRARELPGVTHAAYFGVGDEPQSAVLCLERAGGALTPAERAGLGKMPVDALHLVPRIPRDPRHASKTDLPALRARVQKLRREP